VVSDPMVPVPRMTERRRRGLQWTRIGLVAAYVGGSWLIPETEGWLVAYVLLSVPVLILIAMGGYLFGGRWDD
jgi:hypothetical protein